MEVRHLPDRPSYVDAPLSVLLADDDQHFRAFVAAALERAGYTVHEASTGADALRLAGKVAPRVALLDVLMPGTNGYVVCRELRETFGDQIGIIFVSGTRAEPFDRVAGIMIGADDYLVKPVDPDEVVARVERFAGAPRRRGQAVPVPEARSNDSSNLTPREREVLALLVGGRAQPEIARELHISSKTASTHIQRILAKLGVHSRAQAVALAARDHLVEKGA